MSCLSGDSYNFMTPVCGGFDGGLQGGGEPEPTAGSTPVIKKQLEHPENKDSAEAGNQDQQWGKWAPWNPQTPGAGLGLPARLEGPPGLPLKE